MENEDIYKNLVKLLKMFNNRPYHLAKYLIENGALNDYFIKNVINSKKLNKDNINENSLNFYDIQQMEDFYSSLLDIKDIENKTSIDLNLELERLIKEERYEEAANLRDYIISKKI